MDPVSALVESVLERHPDFVAAWLFGSAARGTAGPDSDVDVAILRGRPGVDPLGDLPLGLTQELMMATGRQVDVVILDDADVDLVHRVLRDGELLLDRDRRVRIEFEVKSRHAYFDLLPRLRAYRSAQIARAAKAS